MQTKRQSIGAWGERVAAQHIFQQGCEILARNVRTPYGELDLVARQDDVIVFVEVKTRTSLSFGLPEISVSERKRQHMIHSAEHYLQAHPELSDLWRLDVIAIVGRPDVPGAQIEWFQDAIH